MTTTRDSCLDSVATVHASVLVNLVEESRAIAGHCCGQEFREWDHVERVHHPPSLEMELIRIRHHPVMFVSE